jgi:hypothetical protein
LVLVVLVVQAPHHPTAQLVGFLLLLDRLFLKTLLVLEQIL